MLANDLTLLVISGMGIAPYSARGLSQTLDPIGASQHIERDVNGEAVDLSIPEMRKYRSRISCTDINTPAIAGIWPGTVVTVECVEELPFPTAHPEMQERPEVSGSMRVEGDHTFYRPILTMIFMGFSTSREEFHRQVAWSFELEEK
jgi:hypothetical protein